jgi:ribose transport system substrate-binding protein
MKNKIVSVLIVLLLSTSLAAFAAGEREEAEGEEMPLVAVSLPGSVEFFSVEKRGMDRAAEELGVKLVYADAEWDAGKQLNQVENFVARGVDMMLLCAADNKALLPAVDRCNEAGVPLITFTNVLGDDPEGQLDGVISFVGINDVNQGKQLGQMAEELMGNKPAKIVLIEGAPGTSCQRLRTEGFEQVAAQHPNWEIVYRQAIDGWTKENALAAMEAFIQTNEEFDIVSCHWHAGAVAACTAIEEAGIEEQLGKDIYVTGLEYTKEIRPLIQQGRVDATNYASIEEMGYKTIKAAHDYLSGKSIPSFIEMEPVIVTKENVDDFAAEM